MLMGMKTCNGCSQKLELSQFARNTSKRDGLQSRCRKCNNKYQKTWYSNNAELQKSRVRASKLRKKGDGLSIHYPSYLQKEVYEILLAAPCVQCGEARPECLEFDHIDPTSKVAAVSTMVYRRESREKVLEEIAKCQVLCANCHRIKTARERNWYFWAKVD